MLALKNFSIKTSSFLIFSKTLLKAALRFSLGSAVQIAASEFKIPSAFFERSSASSQAPQKGVRDLKSHSAVHRKLCNRKKEVNERLRFIKWPGILGQVGARPANRRSASLRNLSALSTNCCSHQCSPPATACLAMHDRAKVASRCRQGIKHGMAPSWSSSWPI